MFELLYLLAGVLLGMSIVPSIKFVVSQWAKRKLKEVENVDEKATIICGACKSVIFSKPIGAVVGNPHVQSFKVYRCQQCATRVTVPI